MSGLTAELVKKRSDVLLNAGATSPAQFAATPIELLVPPPSHVDETAETGDDEAITKAAQVAAEKRRRDEVFMGRLYGFAAVFFWPADQRGRVGGSESRGGSV